MKVGDVILNGWASDDNPIKYGIIIEKGGKYIKVLSFFENGKPHTSRYNFDITKDPNFKVLGNIDLKEEINKIKGNDI